MSILIKGLEMPKITGDFIQEKFVLLICPETGKAEFNDGKKWVDYEMLEVKTPHGRLIDADAILQDHGKAMRFETDDLYHKSILECAPAIIEAEQ